MLIVLNFYFALTFYVDPGITEITDSKYNKLYPILDEYVRDFPEEFRKIPEDRRYRLNEIIYFLEEQEVNEAPWQLLFISTNQSTVSQMAQVWSKAAAYYFGFTDLQSYSGGLDPADISVSTIKALEKAGFIVYRTDVSGTEVYRVKYSFNLQPILTFPKKINHVRNPQSDFMAVIVDENADLNIQNIKGTYHRLFLNYDDPIGYEGSELEDEMFDESCRQVAVEMFYVFARLRKRLTND